MDIRRAQAESCRTDRTNVRAHCSIASFASTLGLVDLSSHLVRTTHHRDSVVLSCHPTRRRVSSIVDHTPPITVLLPSDSTKMPVDHDCIVVGSGHAGSCAALSAIEHGCKRVLVIEKAPKEWAGGNGYFTAGAHRTVHGGLHDLLPIVHNVDPDMVSKIDMDPYTNEQFTDRKSTRLNSSHSGESRMPSSA